LFEQISGQKGMANWGFGLTPSLSDPILILAAIVAQKMGAWLAGTILLSLVRRVTWQDIVRSRMGGLFFGLIESLRF
jgi:hypothetical protein